MTHIFLEESGDLGFSARGSKWFALTIAFTRNHRKIEKCVKKVHKGLKKKYKNVKELKAYHSQSITKKRLLSLLARVENLSVLCILLNKEKIYVDLRNQKNYLYNYTANVLLDRLYHQSGVKFEGKVVICIDQRETNKFLKQNFKNYLHEHLKQWNHGEFEITIKPSHTEKCLQAVDFISWAIFRKYEQSDYEYYEIIKNKIIKESVLFE